MFLNSLHSNMNEQSYTTVITFREYQIIEDHSWQKISFVIGKLKTSNAFVPSLGMYAHKSNHKRVALPGEGFTAFPTSCAAGESDEEMHAGVVLMVTVVMKSRFTAAHHVITHLSASVIVTNVSMIFIKICLCRHS